jgi:tetratricopeptide (TPR) repeat protein
MPNNRDLKNHHDNNKPQSWIIILEGKTLGPFSTQDIEAKIQNNELLGEEKIKLYPDGDWKKLSQHKNFYDQLMAHLSDQSRTAKNQNPMQDEVTIAVQPEIVFTEDLEEAKNIELQKKSDTIFRSKKNEMAQEHKLESANIDPSAEIFGKPQKIIQVQELPKESKNNVKKKMGATKVNQVKQLAVPVALFVGGISIVFYVLFGADDKGIPKPSLLRPRADIKDRLTSDEIKKETAEALKLFVTDTFENYWKAQKILVSVIEKAPTYLDARGLLCLTYKEVWPFVKQDASDLATVHNSLKSIKSLDPIGLNSLYCEISSLMVQGRYVDAKGMIDHALSQPGMDKVAVFYNLKAEVLAADRDYKTAILFSDQAVSLWPEWLRSKFLSAQYNSLVGQNQKAEALYGEVLSQNKNHRAAKLEYGIFLFEKGSSETKEKAKDILIDGLQRNEIIDRGIIANANYTLGKFYAGSSSSKALDYAQKAYELNPADTKYKNFLIELGGSPGKAFKKIQNNELIYLGDQFYRAGDYLSAHAEYAAAFEQEPTNAIAAKKAAESLWKLNQGKEAEAWLVRAIKADGKYATPYYLIADYLSARNDYSSAIEILNKAIKILPKEHEVIRGFGLIELRRNNPKEAIAYLERALKIYSSDADSLVLISKAYLMNNELEKAANHALTAVELDGTNSAARIVYGKILSESNGVDAAVSYMQEQINRFSYSLEYRVGLAEILTKAERNQEAKNIYEQVVLADPKNKAASIGLAENYLSLGLTSQALKYYLNAAIVDPSDPQPLFSAGLVYFNLGQFKEAITQFQRALAVNPLFPRAYIQIGRAAFSEKNYDLALKSAMQEKNINPNIADSYILAGDSYMMMRDYVKSAEQFQEAVKRRPKSADLYVKIARCQIATGNFDVAESMLTIAANLESGLPEIYREQGIIFEKRNDLRAAVQAYSKYLLLAPNAVDRNEIDGKIDKLSK